MHRFLLVFFAAVLSAAESATAVRFRNVAEAAGLRFQIENAPMTEKRM